MDVEADVDAEAAGFVSDDDDAAVAPDDAGSCISSEVDEEGEIDDMCARSECNANRTSKRSCQQLQTC